MGETPKQEVNTTLMDTITVTFPQVKVNLSINDTSFNTLENMVFDITQRIGRNVLEKALYDVDNKLRDQRPKGELINTGKRQKYFLTRLGDIRYKRTRYIDKNTGKSRYLLEEKLGIKINQRISLVRAKIEMFIASLTTYRATKENTELLTGYKRSHEAIRQSVIKEAEGIIAHEKHSIEKTKNLKDEESNSKNPCDIAHMEADSAFIRFQRRRKRGRRVYKLKTTRPRRRRRRSIEIKLGIGYTDKVKRYENGRGKSLKLKDKFTYTAIESGKTFMENLSLIAERKLALSKAKAVIFGGDGGTYIQAGIKDYFTGAVYVLCKFHLKRNIKRALSLKPDMQFKINSLIKSDKLDAALSTLNRIIGQTKDMKKKKAVRDLRTYIEQNKKGINPIRRIEDRGLRERIKGTGAMESNVDKFIAHRFKKRGMSWSVKGALGLLKVKETIANGEWDSWWRDKRDEKIEIDPEPLKQLTAKNFWKKHERNAPHLIEAAIPALEGPDQSEPWARVLRQLQSIDYYKQKTG